MGKLVSILIPAFRAGQWIAQTLESALAQTYSPIEVIVVDDGSPDETLAQARRFERKNVKVVSQSNAGASAARNKALSLAQGDFIQYLDADDLLASQKIEKQMTALQGTPRVLGSGPWGRFIYGPSRAKFKPSPLWCDLAPQDWVLRHMESHAFMQPAAWLVSRELTESAGLWDTRLSNNDDGEYFCRVVLACEEVRFIPEARCFYRALGGASLSYVGASSRKAESMFLSLELNIRHIMTRWDTDRVRSACVTYLRDAAPFFYPEQPELFAKVQALAASLGGTIEPPTMDWKYLWIQKLFGLRAAKRASSFYNLRKSAVLNSYDKFLYNLKRDRSGNVTS